MKKITIIILVVFGAVLSTYAQDEKPKKIGIRAGFHSALMVEDGAGLETTEPLNSFYIGVFKEKRLIPMLHAGSGLEYFQNGFESNLIDLQRKLHYVSAPLYLKVKFGPFYVTGGTALNFKIAETNVTGGEVINPQEDNKSKVFDMPLQAGVGVKILMFSVDTRYHWGMIDVNQGAKNQYFQLGAAVSF